MDGYKPPFTITNSILSHVASVSEKVGRMVYLAAGNDHSAVKLTIAELEEVAGAVGWVDVCNI